MSGYAVLQIGCMASMAGDHQHNHAPNADAVRIVAKATESAPALRLLTPPRRGF